eukprot:XP_001689525.1 predicted protein [Chlamydomonas reinhardtii]
MAGARSLPATLVLEVLLPSCTIAACGLGSAALTAISAPAGPSRPESRRQRAGSTPNSGAAVPAAAPLATELQAHLRTLGLAPGSPLEPAGLKAAFRARAKETHPDLQPAAGKAAAAEAFRAVQRAYSELSRHCARATKKSKISDAEDEPTDEGDDDEFPATTAQAAAAKLVFGASAASDGATAPRGKRSFAGRSLHLHRNILRLGSDMFAAQLRGCCEEPDSFKAVLAAAHKALVAHFTSAPTTLNSAVLTKQLEELPVAAMEALLASDSFSTDDESSVLLLLAKWRAADLGNRGSGQELKTLCALGHEAAAAYIAAHPAWYGAARAQWLTADGWEHEFILPRKDLLDNIKACVVGRKRVCHSMLRQADTSCTEVLVRGFAWSISLQHGLPYGSADVGMYLMCNVPPVMLGPGLKEGELPGIAAPHAKLEVFGGNAAGGAPCTLMSLKYTARRDSPYLGKGWGYAKALLAPWEQALVDGRVSGKITFYRYIN